MQAFENALLEQIKEVLVADRLDDSKVKVVVEVLKVIFNCNFQVYLLNSFIMILINIRWSWFMIIFIYRTSKKVLF